MEFLKKYKTISTVLDLTPAIDDKLMMDLDNNCRFDMNACADTIEKSIEATIIANTGYEKLDLIMHRCLRELSDGATITSIEHEFAQWLTKENLYSVDWLPADIDAVKAIEVVL